MAFLGETFVAPEKVSVIFKEIDNFKSLINPQLRPLVKMPPISGVISYNGFSAIYDVVSGDVTITSGVDKYTKVQLSVKGVFLINTGTLSHDEIEGAFEKWNSGLTTSMAFVQQANAVKAGISFNRLDRGGLRNRFTYQADYFAACDKWYDKLMSTVDYSEKLIQSPVSQGETTGFSIDYPADVLYIESKGEVWVCGNGGILAIDTTTYATRRVYSSQFYFYNMVLAGGLVYALAEDGIYEINPTSGVVAKDVETSLPADFSSIFVSGNATYIATPDGVYSKRPFEVSWQKVFSLTNATMRSTPKLTFAVGKNPENTDDGLVFYSFSGAIWNRSSVFPSITVNSIAQRYNSVYYATNNGLLVEDLSRLFSNSDFAGPEILAAELEDGEDNSIIKINDVDADEDRVIAVTDTGKWYSMSGVSVNGSGVSRLETIHKVKVVDGNYWLFSDNLVEIENVGRLIQLSTGKALL